MNRAVALRIAACGLMGLGAAPAHRRAVAVHLHRGQDRQDPARPRHHAGQRRNGHRAGPRVAATATSSSSTSNSPLALQQQITVESPSNADVVTLQVGSTLRRTDKQQDNGLLLAMVDTVTVNRQTALAVSSESNPGGARAEAADHRRRPAADQHRAAARGSDLPLPVRHREEDLSRLRPDRAEAVRRQLRRRGRRQRPDHLPVQPERRLRRGRQAGRTGQVLVALRRRRRRRGHRTRGAVGSAR